MKLNNSIQEIVKNVVVNKEKALNEIKSKMQEAIMHNYIDESGSCYVSHFSTICSPANVKTVVESIVEYYEFDENDVNEAIEEIGEYETFINMEYVLSEIEEELKAYIDPNNELEDIYILNGYYEADGSYGIEIRLSVEDYENNKVYYDEILDLV